MFKAPVLPRAITDRLSAAPKSIAKVPKLVNDQLVRAQREILISAKPLMELLSFYYSPEFITLKEFVPEIAPVFSTHKMMLSQALALMASAGIKM